MGNIILFVRENKKDLALGSLTNSCYLVLSHLQGVKPPKIRPLSDLASNRVGPLPTQWSLKDALWKLCSLALKISRAETTFRSACANMLPKFLIYSLGKCSLTSLKIPVKSIGPTCCSQYGLRVSIFYLFCLIKVNAEGHH